MNARTKLSAKGQIVIPKDVRDRLGWGVGTSLDVVETPGGVTLRPATTKPRLTFEEATAKLRANFTWDGPIYRDEDWAESIDRMMRDGTDI